MFGSIIAHKLPQRGEWKLVANSSVCAFGVNRNANMYINDFSPNNEYQLPFEG